MEIIYSGRSDLATKVREYEELFANPVRLAFVPLYLNKMQSIDLANELALFIINNMPLNFVTGKFQKEKYQFDFAGSNQTVHAL